MKQVLLILPDTAMTERLRSLLEGAGYACRADQMPDEFAATLMVFKPDLAILDEQLPSGEIEAWSRVISGLSPSTRLLDISYSLDDDRRKVVSAHGYVQEPFTDEVFLAEVRRVLREKLSPEPALRNPS